MKHKRARVFRPHRNHIPIGVFVAVFVTGAFLLTGGFRGIGSKASVAPRELTLQIETQDASGNPLRRWYPSGADGGGFQNVLAVTPHASNHGNVIVGSDVGGFHRSDSFGADMISSSSGMFENDAFKIASVIWSDNAATPDRIYALGGTITYSGGNYTGLSNVLRSDNSGASWSPLLETSVLINGGNNRNQSGIPNPHPRSTGKLLAVDDQGDSNAANDILYIGSYKDGIYKSTNGGTSISASGLSGKYIRSLIFDPTDKTVLYAATYGDGVYRSTNSAGSWTKLTGSNNPSHPEELVVVNGTLYAAANTSGGGTTGIVRKLANAKSTGASTAWQTTGGAGVIDNNNSLMSIDGYRNTSTNQDILYIGCFQPGSSGDCVFKSTNSGSSWTPIDRSPSTVDTDMVRDGGKRWWHSVNQANAMLGAGTYAAAQIVIDPLDTNIVYLAGRAGVWRSLDGGSTWNPATQGIQGTINTQLDTDKTDLGETVHTDADWVGVRSNDSLINATQDTPGGGSSQAVDIDDSGSPSVLYVANDLGDLHSKNLADVSGAPTTGGWTNLNIDTAVTNEDGAGRCSSSFDSAKPEVFSVRSQLVSGQRVIIATVKGCGIFRKQGNGSWTHVAYGSSGSGANTPLFANQTGFNAPIDWPNGSTTVLLYDRNSGVWCSDDRGQTWQRSWAQTAGGLNTGFAVHDALDPKIVYVANSSGLYRFDGNSAANNTIINSSGNCSTVSSPPSTMLSGTVGALASDMYGNLYAVRIENSTNPPRIVKFDNPRSSSTTTNLHDEYYQGGAFDVHSLSVEHDGTLYASTRGTGVWIYRNRTVAPGEDVRFVFKLSNRGTSSTSGPYTVTAQIPSNMTFVGASGSGWNCNTASLPTLTCSVSGSIASNASAADLTVTATVGTTYGRMIFGYDGTNGTAEVSTVSGETTTNNKTGASLNVQPGLNLVADTYDVEDTNAMTLNPLANDSLAPSPSSSHIMLPETIRLTSQPTSGSIRKNVNGTFTYTANNTTFGSEVLTYEVCTNDLYCKTQSMTLTTNSTPTDTTPPSVSFNQPANGATVSGTQSIGIAATDDSGTVTNVQIFIDDALVKNDVASPFNYTWNTTTYSNGNHTIRAVAYDPSGNNNQSSITVTVSNSSGDSTAPSVSITSHTDGMYVFGTTRIVAAASDNVGVTKVEYRVNGTLAATDSSSPFEYDWTTSGLSVGTYTIQVRAYDAADNTTNSSISIKVAANTCGAGKRADMNCDGIVGLTDLSLLITYWGDSVAGDIDIVQDGVVGLTDLSDLITNWGAAPLP